VKNHKINASFARPKNAKDIARLELEAFEGKISWMCQNNIDILFPFVEKYYKQTLSKENNTVIIAKKDDDTLVALLVLKAQNLRITDVFFPVSDLIRVFKRLSITKILRLLIGFLLLSSSPPRNSILLIETLAVDKKHRGCGIGSFLLELTEKIAYRKKYSGIALYVALDNIRARKLYLKNGYRPAKVLKSHFFYTFLGVEGFILMIKKFKSDSSNKVNRKYDLY